MAAEIPAIHGEIGGWSFDFVNRSPASGPRFPTRSVTDHEGKKVAWIRYLSPKMSEHLDIQTAANHAASLIFRGKTQSSALNFLEAIQNGTVQVDEFKILEQYGIRVAHSSAMLAEVNQVPSMILVTEHVEGPKLSEWLRDPEPTFAEKQALSTDLVRKLSTYARDTAILTMRDIHDAPYFHDIGSPRQYVVNNGQPVLIDVGPEHLTNISYSILGDGLSQFHHHLAISELGDYLDQETIDAVKGDLYTIREVEIETHAHGSAQNALQRWESPRVPLN